MLDSGSYKIKYVCIEFFKELLSFDKFVPINIAFSALYNMSKAMRNTKANAGDFILKES